MTKFLFHGILCSLGVLCIMCLTAFAIMKIDSICDVSCINKHFDQPPPCLKIKKVGVHKQITSPQSQFFNCCADKASMKIHLANYTCKESLARLAGNIRTQDLNKVMSFQGKSGILNYQDCSLNVYGCQFQVLPDEQEEDQEEYSTGEVKTLSLSIRR